MFFFFFFTENSGFNIQENDVRGAHYLTASPTPPHHSHFYQKQSRSGKCDN